VVSKSNQFGEITAADSSFEILHIVGETVPSWRPGLLCLVLLFANRVKSSELFVFFLLLAGMI
jgi:hypothetical protein